METAVQTGNTNQATKQEQRPVRHRIYSPAVDLYRKEDTFYLYADIPGAHEKSVDISVEKDILTIKATVEEAPVEGMNLLYSEYGIGDYERSFRLSDDIDVENIQAKVKNGVLELVIPLRKGMTRKIEVKAE
ncbi:MAG: Hsp20/alpha crystallin family protein [Leptospiraceae bacterium]|nr:Hsp20/alpha crystallin family protein [Leptospiraceae bacterium]